MPTRPLPAASPRDLAADDTRTAQVTADICQALNRGRHCLVLTQRTAHLERLVSALRDAGHDPVALRGGMGAKAHTAALARLDYRPGDRSQLYYAPGGVRAGASLECVV